MSAGAPRRNGPGSPMGLLAVFGSTLFQLSGVFMLSPLMLVLLTQREVSTSVAGLFAATTWLGIFIVTPFASALTRRWGQRRTMWFASGAPLLAAIGFLTTDALWLWFALELLAGVAGGLRWVLAEAFIAEFSPSDRLGRYIGIYATMVGATFIIGPTLLAWVGPEGHAALGLVIALLGVGLAWTALIPVVPPHAESAQAPVGLRGLWLAVRSHPAIMLAGFIGGFFELGLASILPLYGLAIGLGAAGSSLYTLSMTDIGAREQGITLVNSTAVLVLNYTLGGLVASALSGALIDWSPTQGFPLVLIAVAAIGLLALLRTRRGNTP